MVKTIEFKYEDNTYVLEFTRATVGQMEKAGFVFDDLSTKPVTSLPMLFRGAFVAHHKYLEAKKIDEIFKKIGNKQDLLLKLAEMYNDTVETLMDEPEDSEGNVQWGASW